MKHNLRTKFFYVTMALLLAITAIGAMPTTPAMAALGVVYVDDNYCDACPNDGHDWLNDAFDNITDALDAAGGTNPDRIIVAAGTYYEDLTFDAGFAQVLIGPQADVAVAGRTAGGTGEAVISGQATLTVDGVSFNGFTFTAPGLDFALDTGLLDASVSYSMFDNIGGASYSTGDVAAILVGAGVGKVVDILDNSFSNIRTKFDTASGIFADAADTLTIADNSFIGIQGAVTHAIDLLGTADPTIAGNSFSSLPTNSSAIFVGTGATIDTETLRGNQFNTGFYGVYNATGTAVDALGNWWGDASGPANGTGRTDLTGTGAKASLNVDVLPWCQDAACDVVLPAVGNVAASDGSSFIVHEGLVSVTWDEVNGAETYNVHRGTTSVFTATSTKLLFIWDPADNYSATPRYRDDGVAVTGSQGEPAPTIGKTYYYWVVAIDATTEFVSDEAGPDAGFAAMPTTKGLIATGGGGGVAIVDKITLDWTQNANATYYEVWRADGAAGSPRSLLKTINDNNIVTYDDKTAVPGSNYKYWVKSCSTLICSGFGLPARGWRMVDAPTHVLASDGAFDTYVEVTWTAAPGARYYTIYRGTTPGAGAALGITRNTAFADRTAKQGTVYYYWVTSITHANNDESVDSAYDTGWR